MRDAILGRYFEFDEAGPDPVGAEFGGSDLEVDIGFTAGFGDLAPAGTDLVAVSVAGIDAIVRSVFGDFFGRNDNQVGVDVQGFEKAGEAAVILFGESAKGDSHDRSPFAVLSRDHPCDVASEKTA